MFLMLHFCYISCLYDLFYKKFQFRTKLDYLFETTKFMSREHKKTDILFILKKKENYGFKYEDANGMSSGLLNSAKFVSDMINEHLKLHSKIVVVEDYNKIDKEIHTHRPKIVVIEAIWVIPSKFEELSKLHPNVKFIIRIHSEIPFLANEGIAMKYIFEYAKLSTYDGLNIQLSTNSLRAQKDLKELCQGMYPDFGDNVSYLPNYYPVTENNTDNKYFNNKTKIINIGCFGAIRPLKNTLKQAVAAIEFANKRNKTLYFHINSGRVEHGDNALKNLKALFENQEKHKLIEHPWLNHEDFIELVKKMDIGLQVSLTETFNIVAADMVNENIPVVASSEISWLSDNSKADPNSTESIVRAIDKSLKGFVIDGNKKRLKSFCEKTVIAWRNNLV